MKGYNKTFYKCMKCLYISWCLIHGSHWQMYLSRILLLWIFNKKWIWCNALLTMKFYSWISPSCDTPLPWILLMKIEGIPMDILILERWIFMCDNKSMSVIIFVGIWFHMDISILFMNPFSLSKWKHVLTKTYLSFLTWFKSFHKFSS